MTALVSAPTFPPDLFDQDPRRRLPIPRDVLSDRRQRRQKHVRQRNVVEPDHGDVVGNFPTSFLDAANYAERHQVGRGKNRR